MIRTHTTYDPKQNLLITELSGEIAQPDLEDWQKKLNAVLDIIPAQTKFKVLVNLYGFKAADLATHKQFREIIPRTLAGFGWYTGYLRMFPEADVRVHSTSGRYCVAAAHVHDDEEKINNYARNFTMKNEGFFSDPDKARTWIDSISIPGNP